MEGRIDGLQFEEGEGVTKAMNDEIPRETLIKMLDDSYSKGFVEEEIERVRNEGRWEWLKGWAIGMAGGAGGMWFLLEYFT